MTPRDGGAPVRPVSRCKLLIGTTAALLALWFGLSAPSVSPVAEPAMPPAPAAVVQDQGAATIGGAVVVDGDGGGGGGGGRGGGRGGR